MIVVGILGLITEKIHEIKRKEGLALRGILTERSGTNLNFTNLCSIISQEPVIVQLLLHNMDKL